MGWKYISTLESTSIMVNQQSESVSLALYVLACTYSISLWQFTVSLLCEERRLEYFNDIVWVVEIHWSLLCLSIFAVDINEAYCHQVAWSSI